MFIVKIHQMLNALLKVVIHARQGRISYIVPQVIASIFKILLKRMKAIIMYTVNINCHINVRSTNDSRYDFHRRIFGVAVQTKSDISFHWLHLEISVWTLLQSLLENCEHIIHGNTDERSHRLLA